MSREISEANMLVKVNLLFLFHCNIKQSAYGDRCQKCFFKKEESDKAGSNNWAKLKA